MGLCEEFTPNPLLPRPNEMKRKWELFLYDDGFCNQWMEENKECV
jgi:hypothetical protein